MSKELDIANWNRRQLFEHYMTLLDPFFALTTEVDVTTTYQLAKDTNSSFFARYLHACICAVNAVENFKYRLHDDKIALLSDDLLRSEPDTASKRPFVRFAFVSKK